MEMNEKWEHLKGSLFYIPVSLLTALRDSYHPIQQTRTLNHRRDWCPYSHATSNNRDLKLKSVWVESGRLVYRLDWGRVGLMWTSK